MHSTKVWSQRDQFRTQYAVLAKHVLCQRSKLKLYQIERSMHNIKKLATAEANIFMSTALAQNLKSDIVAKAIDLGNKFMQTVYFQGVLYGGPIIGITINAALAIHEYNNPEVNPTLNQILSENLITQQEIKIESYLQAYLKSYENKENFNEFVKSSCIFEDDQSKDILDNVKKASFMHPLTQRKNYIYSTIKGETFPTFHIQKQIRMAQLYYQLVKALIEIMGLSQSKKISIFLADQQKQHQIIKKLMIVNIRKSIRRYGTVIVIQGVNGVQIDDPLFLCNQQAFAESIFDEIFRCPATKFVVDCIYEKECWSDEFRQEMKVKVQETAIIKHIGESLSKYDVRKYAYVSRIRRMQCDTQGDWACYYENLNNKAGAYDENWSHSRVCIDMDTAKVIYLNCQKLCILNSEYQSITVHSAYCPPEYTSTINSCFQLDHDEHLLYVQFSGMLDLRFMFVKKTEASLKYKEICGGSVETKDRKFRLAYRPRSLIRLNFVDGYDMEGRDIEDPCQKLVFEAITPVSFFGDGEEISCFTCRVTNEYDRLHFMVRSEKEGEFGHLATNGFGEELVLIRLLEKLSSKNEYIGTMEIGGCPLFLTKNTQIMWESKTGPGESPQKLYIYFNQK